MRISTRGTIALLLAWAAPAAFAASLQFQNSVLDDAPVLYYQFNELSGNAVNYGSLGAGFNATYNGTPGRGAATAQGDAGVGFDDAGDFLESLAASPASLSGNPSFTAEALVFVPTTGSASLWAPLLHWGDGGASRTGKEVYFGFSQNDPTEFFAGFYNGGLQTADTVPRGTWRHLVWVRNGGGNSQAGSTIYVDGVVVLTESDPALCCNGLTPSVTSSAFRVNRARDFTRFFVGTLDELALYDYALTATDVEAHYQASVVPLPAPLALMALPLASMLALARRRRT